MVLYKGEYRYFMMSIVLSVCGDDDIDVCTSRM
jgi:hypothetical protein